VIVKRSYIKKLPGGKWRVLSRSDRNLGTYDTRAAAEERLAQVEMFKHMKNKRKKKKKKRKKALNDLYGVIKESDNKKNTRLTYSELMRRLNKNAPDKVKDFMSEFKSAFDDAVHEDIDYPEEAALLQTIQSVDYDFSDKEASIVNARIVKMAQSVIEMGDPMMAGKSIASVVKFIMKRMTDAGKTDSITNLRGKILAINEHEVASKQTPISAAMGQSIAFIKNILSGQNPEFIRQVLNNVGRFLY